MFKCICMIVLLFSVNAVHADGIFPSMRTMRNFATRVRQRFVGRTPREEFENIADITNSYRDLTYQSFGDIKTFIDDKDFTSFEHLIKRYPSFMCYEKLRKYIGSSLKNNAFLQDKSIKSLLWIRQVTNLLGQNFSGFLLETDSTEKTLLDDILESNDAYHFNKTIFVSGKSASIAQKKATFSKVKSFYTEKKITQDMFEFAKKYLQVKE